MNDLCQLTLTQFLKNEFVSKSKSKKKITLKLTLK